MSEALPFTSRVTLDYFFLATITPISPKPIAIKLRLSGSGTDAVDEAMAYDPVETINTMNIVIFDSICVLSIFMNAEPSNN